MLIMRAIILLAACWLHAACAAPQFVTFKDGKIGVNFGGYHAEAGLGGLLTGNAAHGGLSASAGTPWGPKAAAGLGGSVDGRTAGFGYAGAEANPSVGASAVLGGSAGEQGYIGSEAHANGKVSSNSINLDNRSDFGYDTATSGPVSVMRPNLHETSADSIQKIKPPKKYHLIQNEGTHTSPTLSKTYVKAESTSESSISNKSSNSKSDNTTVMINVHRQRMRERRRQQLQEEIANEQSERKRTIEQRRRNWQRLHPRRGLATRSKSINITTSNENTIKPATPKIETNSTDSMQHFFNNDINAVQSKHLIKTEHKSLATDESGALPLPPPPAKSIEVNYNANSGVIGNALNIPIGILRVIQDSLTGISVQKNFAVSSA